MGLTQASPGRCGGSGWQSLKTRALAGLIFSSIIALSLGTFAWGSPADQQRQTPIILDVVDAPLTQVVRLLTQQSGFNIIIAGDADMSSKKVTARLDGLPLDKALDYIVSTAGISYKKMDDGTYLVGTTASIAAMATPVLTDKAPIQTANPVPAPERPVQKIVTDVIKLVHSAPADILRVLGVNSSSTGTSVSSVSVNNGLAWTPGQLVTYNTNTTSHLEPVTPVPQTTDTTSGNPSEAMRYQGEPRTEANQYTPTMTTGTRATYTGRPGTTVGTTATAPGTATTPGATTTQQGLLPPGIDYIMGYDVDNSLIVRGTPEAIADLKDVISRYLDIPPKQVSIKAEFIEVDSSLVDHLGIDWDITGLNNSFSTNFNPTGNVVWGFQSGNINATLRAELTTGKARVVNSPIISTLNNTAAMINIGSFIPYFTSTVQVIGQQSVTHTQVNSLPVQTYLYVLPRVNGDNTITLFFQPSVQDVGQTYKSPDGQELPATLNQTLSTNRRVMSGETIVVGGFIRRSDSTSANRVPILGDLPWIGGLFRSTSKTNDDRELLIFLTPTIIPEKGGTTLGVIS